MNELITGLCTVDYTAIGGGIYTEQVRANSSSYSSISQQGDHKTPTPFSYSKSRLRYPHGFINQLDYPYVKTSGELFGRTSLPYSSLNLDDLAVQSEDKALGKYNDILRGRKEDGVGHDLLMSIFESPELKDLYAQMKEHVLALKKMKFLKLMQRASPAIIAAEYYLLWTFGIAPLIGAMEEILKTLQKGLIENEEKIKATAVARSEGTDSIESVDGPIDVLYSNMVRTSFQSSIKLEDMEMVLMHQFGLSTPGASYYAVLPLSFVFDWFIDVGGYLDTVEYMSHKSGFTQSHLFKSQTKVSRVQYSRAGYLKDSNNFLRHVDEQSSIYSASFQRTVIDELPLPHLPSFKPRLNGGKITSLFALATTILSSK